MQMKQATIRKFSSIRSTPLSPAELGGTKKSVPGPTSPWHFISLLLFSTLRRPLSVDTYTKAGIYLCISAGGSLIFDFIRAPPSYFSNKYNVFNQLFVKWGWAWTCSGLSAFLIFSSFVYTGRNVVLMRAHITRVVAGTGFWYTMTGLFNFIHDVTGHCHPKNLLLNSDQYPSRRVPCHRAGGVWLGFDVSGHCFLLVLSSLWIMEELRPMLYWNRLADILKPYEQHSDEGTVGFSTDTSSSLPRGLSPESAQTMRSAFRRLTGSVRVLFSLVACLSMLWDFMFLVTVVYFHTMPSKLLGTLIAVACWFICYRVIFPSAKTGDWCGLAPGMPGDGPVAFTPRR
ncbi:hypothetical protein AHF37_03167 [Paragonimus kellicotti]|nr:hypothetical protein AHF37_03167 [Paragonimus kellicotti]